MKNGTGNIRRWPFYILLFPVFFILHGYADNFRFVSTGSVLLLCLGYMSAAILITVLFYFLYKDLSKAALLAFFILAFDFFFGSLLDFLREVFPTSFIVRYSFLVPAFLVLFVILFFIIKKRKALYRVNYYLNTLLVLLIVIDVAILITRLMGNSNRPGAVDKEMTACDRCSKPDVYVIVLDEYAGQQETKDILAYSNQPFLDSLGARGFKTIDNSQSNYSYTAYSTASFLNMEYLDPDKSKSVKKGGYKYAINKIENNRFVNFFHSLGYRFFNCSPFTIAGQSTRIEGSFVPTNTKLITVGTFLNRFEKDVMLSAAEKFNMEWYLKRVMYVTLNGNNELLALTKKTADTGGDPKLVYTHLLMPHYPYYYNEAGQLRSFEALRKSSLDNNEDYLAYLKYTNGQVIQLVDYLLSHSARPPVIVLASDHGYRQYKNQADQNYFFTNLLSVHLPGGNYNLYTDSTDNVNFLRLLLNSQFGQKLPLLEHKTFMIDF
ncbi:MAG TPA: sulfatase-like hydrolase/transferase [Chitinophagaceae bacterium]|nr:sulfatase-like hydrolase/transferase [Chitinophagaceae bacterium]